MHGCNSGSALLVNAEVDSMGGVVDGGVGIGVKTSPRRVAIEKAQAELRQEYDVREERRRELEFLEKGGNPLDFKFGNAASVSVQSTSLTDQQAEHFAISEAKGSFGLTASPHGDSVESSGRPGIPAVCEPNSADNLLLFHGENELPEGERKSMHPRKKNTVVPSEQSSQMGRTQNAKESEDSAIFRPYARRNRSKLNRDAARSSSTEMGQGRGGHGPSLPARVSSKDEKVLTNNQKDKNMPSVNIAKSATSNGNLASKVITSGNLLNMELDGGQAAEATTDQSKGDLSKSKVDATVPNEPVQVDVHKSAVNLASEEPDLVGGKEQAISTGFECPADSGANKAENETISNKLNGFGDAKRDGKNIRVEGQNSSAARGVKGLDSESSCTENSLSLDVNNDNDACINPKNVDSNGKPMEQTSEKEESLNLAVGELAKEKNEIVAADNVAIIWDAQTSKNQNHSLTDSIVKVEEEVRSELQNEVSCPSNKEVQQSSPPVSEADRKTNTVLGDNSNSKNENICASGLLGTMGNFICEIPERTLLGRTSTANTDVQTNMDGHVKVVDKAHEDSILEEARIIEAKRKRIAELSVGALPLENRRKSHWDFVLEEMAWLANDFAQERLWKMTAATQLCRRAAFTSRLKYEEQNQFWKLKRVALTLANAVMEFWHSAELLRNSKDRSLGPNNCGHDLVGSRANEVTENKNAELDMVLEQDIHEEQQEHPGKNNEFAIQAYAVRFLKYNSSPVPTLQAEAPATPDRISDSGITDISWNEHLTEESLFYSVPSGAMETYRRSIESYLVQTEKTGSSAQEEVETSAYDDGAEFGYGDFVYDEDEGETSTYYLPGAFEGRKSSKLNKKKRKNPMKSYPARPYEMDADLPYGSCAQQSVLIGKRPGSSLNVGPIPTKRVRTGSRQRVISPFGSAAAAGGLQAPMKTDASSGDTNSFQDDQSTLHGGFQMQKSNEVESIGDFERQLPYDCAETPTKPKKKKKAKNLVRRNSSVLTDWGLFIPEMLSAYDQGWQLESTVHSEQRDYSKKRSESHHFDSNGSSVLYGQQNAKKLKLMKQQPDNAFDINPSGSIPSPVGSQMSNMSNPNKIIRLIHGRDRGRKAKTLKMSAGEPGSGCPWSLFEDQALVVLVHDMGPNWELISDAINSTLQFKCIFRKPKECKERHKILMDRSGDGADSADDSGSSQPYPSTLPGIPKGSARQLFQRLQGPMEEDTLKSHFEKIIHIGKKQHYRRNQHDNQDPKQIVPVHNSHVIALSPVCPNKLNGGVLTPLDLCDATASSQDVLPLGNLASNTSGLAISNQGAAGSMLPASAANSSLQGSSGMVLGSNLASLSTPLNSSVRNVQQSNLSLPGAVSGSDRMVRVLSGNNLGMMCGINRSMPISRPGFQGMTSSAMLNSGSMLSSNLVGGMQNPVNMHSGTGSGQGNSMLRPRDTKHMMRPGHSPELQMQAQGNGQGISAFNGLNSAYPNQSTAPSVQSYPGHPQQQQQMPQQQSHALSNSHHPQHQGSNHASGPQQQAYAMRVAKERQMQQQRLMQQQQPQQQQQKQFTASSALMSHVQPQTQLPISSSLQNSSQIQSQASTQPVSLPAPSSPMTPMSLQHQQKHHLAPHGLGRNPQTGASGLNNQIGKQRQRQPQQQQQQFQQSGRHHPQQRQPPQSQQQTKLLKGVGRGNMLVHQNLSADPAHLNGLSMASSNQAAEKGEQIMHLMQGQGLYPGPGTGPVQQSKPLVSQPQQKLFSGATPPSTKQPQQMASHSDNSSQGQVSTVPSGHIPSAGNQCVLPASVGPNHQHLQLQSQPHQKKVNQNQSTVQRVLQQNRQVNSDPLSKPQAEPAQADQQPMNNASQMGTTTTAAVSEVGIDSANNTVQNVPSAGSQWKSSDPVYNPGMPTLATQVGSIGSPPLTNSAASVPLPSFNQGLGQRQLPGGLPLHGSKAGAQRPQLPQIQQSSTPAPSQQHYQPQEQLQQDLHNSPPQQLPLQQQSQQQTPHLQAVQGSLYHRPSNSKPE
ncbi:chromatin modification-related protein EAF1 B isoform X8 [Gossypium raimondii]|uniref:chromatin modification-related protein EAF1 B isoform X8 n=1 Tax=Gossypium raimondii TaxID=29730 RepID=UPI00063AD42D|nr:chromatin modification-related protein EAF1 B isoform X8 [Gossypium raimondii]